ncbi:hypothetical protein Bcep1808_0262 [Burkholderia vietnamiensis G4]|uniref:Uncharacterized protein n=1 Tax=Burkholderia vietnamiensis (strain G4 / LMG 22486) TaxID=269482 RepID=A4JAH4_BURVG|nr:hypothetical protein Bcep1808_0262 [Burkholderia vietnamiensis G4]
MGVRTALIGSNIKTALLDIVCSGTSSHLGWHAGIGIRAPRNWRHTSSYDSMGKIRAFKKDESLDARGQRLVRLTSKNQT